MDKTAQAMAKALGVDLIDDGQGNNAGVDDTKNQDTAQDKKDGQGSQADGGDATGGDNSGDSADNVDGSDNASDTDNSSDDTGSDNTDGSSDGSDAGDGSDQSDQKRIPDIDEKSGQDQTKSFEDELAERSGGRFKSFSDIEQALEEIPENAFANERVAKLNEYIKQGGSFEDYVRTQTTDYSKMNAFELIREQQIIENPDLTQEEIELLIEDQFGVPEGATERQQKLAQAKLKSAGSKALKELQAIQKEWATPERNTAEEARKWEQDLNSATDSLTDINVTLNKTDNFKFQINDELKSKVKSEYKDVKNFFKRYINPDGSENTQKFVKDMIILDHWEEIARSAASSSKTQGKKDVVDNLKNPDFAGKDKSKDQKAGLSIAAQAAQAMFGK